MTDLRRFAAVIRKLLKSLVRRFVAAVLRRFAAVPKIPMISRCGGSAAVVPRNPLLPPCAFRGADGARRERKTGSKGSARARIANARAGDFPQYDGPYCLAGGKGAFALGSLRTPNRPTGFRL